MEFDRWFTCERICSNTFQRLVCSECSSLKMINDFPPDSPAYVKRMGDTLRDLLATWFTTGLLEVERVTWQSPCEIGECYERDRHLC